MLIHFAELPLWPAVRCLSCWFQRLQGTNCDCCGDCSPSESARKFDGKHACLEGPLSYIVIFSCSMRRKVQACAAVQKIAMSVAWQRLEGSPTNCFNQKWWWRRATRLHYLAYRDSYQVGILSWTRGGERKFGRGNTAGTAGKIGQVYSKPLDQCPDESSHVTCPKDGWHTQVVPDWRMVINPFS